MTKEGIRGRWWRCRADMVSHAGQEYEEPALTPEHRLHNSPGGLVHMGPR